MRRPYIPSPAILGRPDYRLVQGRRMRRPRCRVGAKMYVPFVGEIAMRDRDLLGEISGRLTGLLQSGGAAASDLRGKIEQ